MRQVRSGSSRTHEVPTCGSCQVLKILQTHAALHTISKHACGVTAETNGSGTSLIGLTLRSSEPNVTADTNTLRGAHHCQGDFSRVSLVKTVHPFDANQAAADDQIKAVFWQAAHGNAAVEEHRNNVLAHLEDFINFHREEEEHIHHQLEQGVARIVGEKGFRPKCFVGLAEAARWAKFPDVSSLLALLKEGVPIFGQMPELSLLPQAGPLCLQVNRQTVGLCGVGSGSS